MSYEEGTATGVNDLLVKWFDFLQANGWTADVDWATSSQSPEFGIIQRKVNLSPEDETTVNLQAGFARAIPLSGDEMMNIIPMRDYVSGNPQDAVEVATSTNDYDNNANHIRSNFPTTPFENYFFFESDFYAHAVVEYATGFFRHFGMGSINKIGKWFGGDYYYGSFWSQANNVIENAVSSSHTMMLDSQTATSASGSVMYGKQIDGSPFPDLAGRQSPESAWHAANSSGDSGTGVGTDADARDRGGLLTHNPRGGIHYPFLWLGRSPFNGYRPLNPFTVYTNYVASSPDNIIPLGNLPDIRSMSMMDDLLPGDEFVVGADTWKVFPIAHRRPVKVLDDTEQSYSFGVAYKKVLV